MAENKTVQNDGSVDNLVASVENDRRREDTRTVIEMMKKITGIQPKLWGSNIIGFDEYHYKYDSGREGEFFRTGCAPRKQALTVYVMPGFEPYEDLLTKLGKYKTGRSCLYINKLDDVDMDVLETLIERSYKDMNKKYPKA